VSSTVKKYIIEPIKQINIITESMAAIFFFRWCLSKKIDMGYNKIAIRRAKNNGMNNTWPK
jgi:hypothetical protein